MLNEFFLFLKNYQPQQTVSITNTPMLMGYRVRFASNSRYAACLRQLNRTLCRPLNQGLFRDDKYQM